MGKLRARVDAVDQQDEISHVGRSFNRMAAALERQREESRKSEENYRMLFEETKELVFISTPEGRYLDINPAGVELLGYSSKDEVLQLNINTDVYANPEQRKIYAQLLAENGFVKDYELELKRKDGQKLTVLSTTTAVRNKKGDIVAYQGVNHDITARKQESEMLREGWERLDLALRSANMGVWHWDIIEDRRDFDAQAFHLLGITPSTFAGTAAEYFGVIHPDDREKIRAALASTIEQNAPYESEYRVIWPDGSVHYISGRGRLVRDDKGRPVRMHGIHWDITERKRAEEVLHESENKTRSIIESLPIGIHMYRLESDSRLVFIGANPAADKILGVDNSAFIGKTIEDAFPALRETEVPQRYREAAASGKMWYAEQIDYHKDAIQGAFEVYAFQTTPNTMVAAFEDITERKRVDEALRKSEERFKRLVQNSNDITTLLNENGIQTAVSGPLERILGYKPKELIGTNVFELVHPDDVEAVKKSICRRCAAARFQPYGRIPVSA
jgi:PAS domain S-box-containing protein